MNTGPAKNWVLSRRLLLLLVWLPLSACDSGLPSGSRVAKLRLLALRTEPVFARPGERVELQLLAADGRARPLQFAFGTCTNPAGSTLDHCLDAIDAPLVPLESEAGRFTFDMPPDVLRGVSEAGRSSALVGAIVAACPGVLEAGETAGVPIACRDADGARLPITGFEVGVKRIYVRTRDRNENPSITRITWDGKEWPEGELREARACENTTTDDINDCGASLRHRIVVDTSEPESGVDESGVEFREQQIVHFYATHGVFERAVRVAQEPDNRWAAQRTTNSELARFWFIVRDDRGGTSWAERQVRVR